MTHEAQAAEQRGYRLLRYACILYIVGFALHTADHFRRGTDTLTPEVFWLAGVANVVGVIVIALVFTGHSLAPLAAVVKGFTSAILFAAVHFLPEWSAFSDAFPGGAERGVEATSWAGALIEIAGLLAVGAAGTYMLVIRPRRAPLAPPTTPPRAASRALPHPRRAASP